MGLREVAFRVVTNEQRLRSKLTTVSTAMIRAKCTPKKTQPSSTRSLLTTYISNEAKYGWGRLIILLGRIIYAFNFESVTGEVVDLQLRVLDAAFMP